MLSVDWTRKSDATVGFLTKLCVSESTINERRLGVLPANDLVRANKA